MGGLRSIQMFGCVINVKEAVARSRASSVLLPMNTGEINHEAGKGGNRNHLSIQSAAFPPSLFPMPRSPPLQEMPLGSGWDRESRAKFEHSRLSAVPSKLFPLCRHRLRSLGAKRLSRWHAPVRRAFHPCSLNAPTLPKLMLLHLDGNNVFIIHLLFTREM